MLFILIRVGGVFSVDLFYLPHCSSLLRHGRYSLLFFPCFVARCFSWLCVCLNESFICALCRLYIPLRSVQHPHTSLRTHTHTHRKSASLADSRLFRELQDILEIIFVASILYFRFAFFNVSSVYFKNSSARKRSLWAKTTENRRFTL